MKAYEKGSFKEVSAGTHMARCVRLIDLGTHDEEYMGKINTKRDVMITWEVSDEFMDDGRPLTISAFYTLSLSKKANLRAMLIGWRGRDFTAEELAGFDMSNILDKVCMLNIAVKANGRSDVVSVSPPPKGFQAPERVNPIVMYSLEPDERDDSLLDGFSDWVRDRIESSEEFSTKPVSKAGDVLNPMDDDIPFN